MSTNSVKRIKLSVILFLLILVCWALTGCKSYRASHIVLNADGSTNSITREYYGTLLIVGEASQLKASTVTPGYTKTIGIEKIATKGDAESVRAGGDFVGELGGAVLKP